MSKNKLVLCMIATVILLMVSLSTVASAETTYMENVKQLIDYDFPADYYMTREDFCASAVQLFLDSFPENEIFDKGIGLEFADTDKIELCNIPYIAALYNAGILNGIAEGGQLYMKPKSTITRQDAITLLGRLLNKSSDYDISFEDSQHVASYAYSYVAYFNERKIIQGYPDGTLKPFENITAGEFAALAIRTYNFQRCNQIEIIDYAGTGSRGYADGAAASAKFTQPHGIFNNKSGDLIVLDTYNNLIRRLSEGSTDSEGIKIETVTGVIQDWDDSGFSRGNYLDGRLKSALFNRPSDGVANSKGELFIADSGNSVIRIITDGRTYTFCGTSAGYADGPNKKAMFNNPMAIAIDKNDYIYVADTLNNCIRKIDPEGNATTIAGAPGEEGIRDGTTKEALFRAPSGIAVSDDGKAIYVSDTGNHVIRKIENGKVTTIAGFTEDTDEDGDPVGGFRDDSVEKAMFNLPMGLALADEILIVADSANHRIRAISLRSGNVSTVAGNGEPGDGDGGALDSPLHHPMSVYRHIRTNMLYIADTGNNKIKAMPFNASLYD